MKGLFFLACGMLLSVMTHGQTPPPDPAVCRSSGNFRLTVTGSTSFALADISDFSNSETNSSLVVNVRSNSARYRLYIAGEILEQQASPENTPIPMDTFAVVASNAGTGPSVPFRLQDNVGYQLLAEAPATGGGPGREHRISITRGPLSDFTQAPGAHTLLLHLKICQY